MSDLPKAIYTETMTVDGIELTVHVLDNGQRVIDADSMEQFFALMEAADACPQCHGPVHESGFCPICKEATV